MQMSFFTNVYMFTVVYTYANAYCCHANITYSHIHMINHFTVICFVFTIPNQIKQNHLWSKLEQQSQGIVVLRVNTRFVVLTRKGRRFETQSLSLSSFFVEGTLDTFAGGQCDTKRRSSQQDETENAAPPQEGKARAAKKAGAAT